MKKYYKIQEKIIFMVVLALILQIAAPAIGSYSFAEEQEELEPKELINSEKPKGSVTTGGAFTLELNKVTDLDGNEFTGDNQLNPKDEFKLDLEWDLEDGHNYKDGDKIEFNLPKGIKITEDIPVVLKDDTGLDVANAIVKPDGTVEMTFTDYVETHSNVVGYINIISKIDEENAEVEDGEIVLKPIGDEGEIRIPVDLGERKKTIEKKGTPNKGYNADEIDWAVTINKLKNNLNNAKVTDVLPAGTEYKEGSLKVTKLKVDLNGNILGDLEEVDITGETVDEDGTLSILLGDIKDAYRIEYVTKVTDDEQKIFKNDATLVDDDLKDISADATVTINRGDPIKKSAATGYNPKTGIIEWKIEFNFNQKDLTDITLKDAWTPVGKMSLVEDSLKFQEVTIDENGDADNEGDPIDLPEGATLVNGEDQFEITGITTDKAYIVTYETKVNDRVLEAFKISNTAGFGSESSSSGKDVGTYYGSKSAGIVDYKNKTIDWTIELNHDEYPIEKISIEDTLGDGLTLIEDSIEITEDGQPYGDDYNVLGDNPFTIEFPDSFTTDKKIVIKYKTNFIANQVPDNKATNKADLTWTPDGGGDSITKEDKDEKPLNTETEDNSWKNGSYNPQTKEITWTIYTNYRENQIDNLIVKDEPQGNQKIVEGSAVVTELEILANGKIKDGDILDEDNSTIDTVNNSLTVTIGNTNKAYKIEYKTSLANLSDIQKEYVNKAEVFDGDNSLSRIDAKVGIAKAHTYGAKSGKQDGKQIHWAVTVNPGQQKVANLKLVDTVSDNQDILTDTFKVYEATVDKNGNATKGDELASSKYTLTHTEGEPTFTVKWNDTVERAFIVEYSTLFFEKHNGEVTNSYTVTGDNIVDGATTGGDGSVTIKQLGSGGGSGEAGYLVIDKVDVTYGQDETKLEGAEFDLIDPDTTKVLKSGTTDANGQIDFGRLLFGEYELHERIIPENYSVKDEKQTIIIDKVYNAETDKTEYSYRVENYIPVFAIELIKTNDAGNVLEGAEFALFDSKDEDAVALETAKTNDEGKILFENLEEAGTYYVQETKAPAGYELNTKLYEVTVGEEEQLPLKINIKNRKLINISGVKTWKDEEPTDRPDSIKVELTRKVEDEDDESFSQTKTVTPDSMGNWVYEFNGLYEFDENGVAYTYIIKEANVPNNYKATVDGHDIINVRIGKTEVSGTKRWKDDTVSDRPDSITVNLMRNNVVIDTKEVTADNSWKYSFINLDKYDKDGKYYEYKVSEKQVPGYAPEITDNDITNTRSGKTQFEITKGWLDDDSENRPDSILVYVYQNDELFNTVELTASENWEYELTDLEAYDEDGQPYTYTIEEKDLEGYKTTIDGFNITNLRVGETEVLGKKIWKDDDNATNGRPDSITVQLLANGEELEDKTLLVTEENNWEYSFNNLPKYDTEGREITYTIDEVEIEGYSKNIDGNNLINTRTGKIEVKATKIWKGGSSKKPAIELQLYRNGEEFEKPVELKDGESEYTWSDLDCFDENGVEYKYTVDEVRVPYRYRKSISDDGLTITNKYRSPSRPPTDPEDPDPEDPTDPDNPDPEDPIDPEDPDPEDPTDPDNPDPQDPIDPEDPDPEDPTDPEDPGEDVDDGDTPKGGTEADKPSLPNTGEANNLLFYIGGLLLIVIGVFLRKRVVEE